MMRRIMLSLITCMLLALACRQTFVWAQIPEAPPPAKLVTASGRTVFWRGEQIGLLWSAPLEAPATVQIALTADGDYSALPGGIPVYQAEVKPVDGIGHLSVLLPTDTLGDGSYLVIARCGGQTATSGFTLRETTTTTPGMIIDESGTSLAPNSRLAGQTGMMGFMVDAFTGPQPNIQTDSWNSIFDRFADQQVLYWNQDATRPFSFYPPSSSPNTNDEYLRRMLLGNTILMRYPAFGGQVFDYDPTGFLNFHVGLTTYWGWGNLRDQLRQYLLEQEKALYANFRKQTGLEPLSDAESMALAAALGSPEAMGYIDLPTRRWAYEIAARSPQMDARQLASLKRRAFAWYGYLMSMNKQRYTGYLQELRRLDPSLRFSSSNTINHATPRNGADHGTSYEPLDFRYVAVWDDQGGAPEHIYETELAASLLNINRSPDQPLWIDTVTGLLNGNHFRNAVQVAGRGGQGTGYAMEMGANLGAYPGGNGNAALMNNSPRNQEYAANAELMKRFGGVFANTRHVTRVGLLYSNTQGVVTPYAQSYCDGLFKMMYLLAHVGMPPALVSERMLERGLSEEIDSIIVLGQTEELPSNAMRGLRAFAARGGRIIADSATTVPWSFLDRSEALDIPFRDLGHPYNMMTAYNRQDATVGVMRELAAKRCPQLRALLQASIYHVPLDALNPDVAVSTLRGGTAAFVTVANDSMLDLAQTFTPEQQRLTGFQQLFVGHGIGAIGSWMPLRTELLLSPELGEDAAVYDLFTAMQLDIKRRGGGRLVACDLSGTPARIIAVYPAPVGAGSLAATQAVTAGETIELRYQATDSKGKSLAAVVPVEITLTTPDGKAKATLYRATDEAGALNDGIPTGVLDTVGDYRLTVRQLLDQKGCSLPVSVKKGTPAKAVPAPRVAVRNPDNLRKFLAGKPEIVVPVFDPASLPFAQRAVDGLVKKGAKARLWENPAQVNYALAYVVKPEEQPLNDRVDAGDAIGKVQFVNNVHHINGNFYGSAMTGFRYGKNILLIGLPGTNPVLDGVKNAGLLWSDGAAEQPGGALVQWLPWALSRNADTIVVTAADADGLLAGVDALCNPPAADPVADGVRAARQRMFQSRALPLTYRYPASKKPLTSKNVEALETRRDAGLKQDFALTAVTDVQEMGGDLVVTLGRYGNMLAVMKRDNTGAFVVPALSSTDTVACGKSIIVTSTPRLTFAWTRDGKPLWRALGEFKAIIPGTDEVIVESESAKFRVTPEGNSAPFTNELPSVATPPAFFKAEPVVEKKGNEEILKSVRVIDTRSGKEIDGLQLTAVKPAWNQPFRIEQLLVNNKDGNVLLVFRRYAGENAVQVYDAKAGAVSKVTIDTAYLTDAALSRDDQYIALCGMEGNVQVVDLTGKEVAKLRTGAFPHLFPLADNSFAVGTADGQLSIIDIANKKLFTRNLLLERGPNPEEAYRQLRAVKLLTWSNPPIAQGPLPMNAFYWYLHDTDGEFKLINWSPTPTFDFRWTDAVQGQVNFPQAKSYTVTVRAAAKYFDDQPMAQPSWAAILDARAKVIKNERPAPIFRLYLDGKQAATLAPEGGALKPFVTKPTPEGWASLTPKDEELTTFTLNVDLPAGTHQIGLEAVNMEDCYVKEFSIK